MKKRIFIAVDISEEARRKTAVYVKSLREKFPQARVSWDKPEKLHLTLKFVGEIDDEQLAELIEATERTAKEFAPFKLQIAETGVFPSTRQAKVLWLDVKDEKEKLRELNQVLENECANLGFKREKRSFKAHLTIARLRERANELVKTHLKQNFQPIEFEVSELIIYQSELRPTGSIYSVISKQKFTGMTG